MTQGRKLNGIAKSVPRERTPLLSRNAALTQKEGAESDMHDVPLGDSPPLPPSAANILQTPTFFTHTDGFHRTVTPSPKASSGCCSWLQCRQ